MVDTEPQTEPQTFPRFLSIEERNAAFEKLTPKEKRIRICQDALMLLRERVIGTRKDSGYMSVLKDFENGTLSCSLENSQGKKVCNCCAKGALLAGLAWNKPGTGIFDQDHWIKVALRGIFDKEGLNLIECAYEQSPGFASSEQGHCAASFGLRYRSRTKRLEAILLNVIENEGTFVV